MNCDHEWRFVFGKGEDAPGSSLDTIDQCAKCGTIRHDYAHGGGQKSPNYPRFVAYHLEGK